MRTALHTFVLTTTPGRKTAPFPVSPSGGKPGREGSPHAGGTSRASKQRWHAPCGRLPPQEGCRPLVHPRWASRPSASGEVNDERLEERRKTGAVYTKYLTLPYE